MKIAMIDPSLFTGRYDDALCTALAAQGHDVTLLGRPLRDTDALAPVNYRYSPRYFGLSERLPHALTGGKLFRAAKALEYGVDSILGPQSVPAGHIVHSQWLPFGPADAQIMRRLHPRNPLVHTVHNIKPYHADNRAKALQGMGYYKTLSRFDALIVHGEPSREALAVIGFDPGTISVIPHPPITLARADAITLASVPDPALPRVLFFGTLRPYKGLDVLLAACLSLWRAGHRFELGIAGKPFMPIEPLLDTVRAAGFGDMLITDFGFLKEARLDAHLQKADILAFPYHHIDASGAFMAALHYGAAMVCSDVGMFATLPEVDGEPGVAMSQAGNVASLTRALLPLIESPAIRTAYGARAISLAQQLGTWKETAVRTLAVYDMACDRARARGVQV